MVLRRTFFFLLVVLTAGPRAASAQSVAGIDVFLHFFLPLSGTLEKVTIHTLHDHDQVVPLHLAADRTLAKFTPVTDLDLDALVTVLQVRGVPLLGVEVMWPGAPTYRALVPTPDGAWMLQDANRPDDSVRSAAKRAWIEAYPELYDDHTGPGTH
ncbi:MAG TPA: hypothetical protein PKE21_16205 [Flavobacteriales bacterium]|nr:hypothetical protein [Flavobacteriales bacterium]HMR29022.1 hypothetical protein [Flavobacteriales bacterium]